jgi:RNA polymerase-interacting CarD/CdnL/TRCF family regulator
MTKRHLNEKEKIMVRKNIDFLTKELKYLEAIKKQKTTAVEIAPEIYEKQLDELKASLHQIELQVDEHKNAIPILEDQIKHGVEEKNDEKSE